MRCCIDLWVMYIRHCTTAGGYKYINFSIVDTVLVISRIGFNNLGLPLENDLRYQHLHIIYSLNGWVVRTLESQRRWLLHAIRLWNPSQPASPLESIWLSIPRSAPSHVNGIAKIVFFVDGCICAKLQIMVSDCVYAISNCWSYRFPQKKL